MSLIKLSLFLLLLWFVSISNGVSSDSTPISSFSFSSGFQSPKLYLYGTANIKTHGLLALSDLSRNSDVAVSRAFYPTPFVFKENSSSPVSSFSTHIVFQMDLFHNDRHCDGGMTFVLAPTMELSGEETVNYLGLFNKSNMGNSSNHLFAVELDTREDSAFDDRNANHVGIDINTLVSLSAKFAGYYEDDRNEHFRSLNLQSGRPMNLWVDYHEENTSIEVTLAPLKVKKPIQPLLSKPFDLSDILNRSSYVGFTAACTQAYILGWSFTINGTAPELLVSSLPRVPRKPSKLLAFLLPGIGILLLTIAIVFYVRREIKYSELIESWEVEYISHRFKYRNLYIATKGFNERHVVGKGGFGTVYRGLLRHSNIEIAVKRISRESRQGMKEFVSEIVSIGRLRHRNLTPLLGYCRRKKDFFLVYEYMPNGSLDKHLHSECNSKLDWNQRFHIIKGVAYGLLYLHEELLYLHEEWEQVVIHRDIKPSNVLLDGAWNARVGDFGLARLCDHGSDQSTTKIVGTLGYIAPEHTHTGKATKSSDVYSFGTLMLEVATGRRPLDSNSRLLEWVHSLYTQNEILVAIDPDLVDDYSKEEAEFVLKLGLLCSHVRPQFRPTMKDVVSYLEDLSTLPEHLLSDRRDFLFYDISEFAYMLETSSSISPLSISSSVILHGRK